LTYFVICKLFQQAKTAFFRYLYGVSFWVQIRHKYGITTAQIRGTKWLWHFCQKCLSFLHMIHSFFLLNGNQMARHRLKSF